MDVTLLGPQRHVAGVRATVAELVPDGLVAGVNAGWREREADVAEMDEVLGGRLVALELHRRWQTLLDADPGLAAAEQRLAARLEELRTAYRLRLEHALLAVRAVQQRVGEASLREAAVADGLAAVRSLDAWHLAEGRTLRAEHEAAAGLADHDLVGQHRSEVARLLRDSAGLVVTGGHVGVLLHVLRLFAVAEHVHGPVITWSAGAMALAEQVVLFHDHPPRGERPPQVHADGLGLYPGVVPLPHAARRLRLGDAAHVSLLAQRLAPRRAVLLPGGARLDLRDGEPLPATATTLTASGQVQSVAAAA